MHRSTARHVAAMILGCLVAVSPAASGSPTQTDFADRPDSWRVVVDGVMGGRSSGLVAQNEPGVLRFTGDLSLENNGGFSQIRTSVPEGVLGGATQVELRVRGDGRRYQFDIRCSHVRMMAGGFQQTFDTVADEWVTVRLPLEGFRLYTFGRRVASAPALEPARIESVGITLADKVPGPFQLDIDSIRFTGAETSLASGSDSSTSTDLVSVARGAGLTTLLELVNASGLEFPAGQRITIFAPTNEAFAALPEATVQALLTPEGREDLRNVLTYHASLGELSSSELLSRRSVDTINGQRLAIEGGGAIAIGGASLVVADVPFDGGVVHAIDRVLIPEQGSIAENASSIESLSILISAVNAADLGDQLSDENGPFTLFAPVDSAFAELPAETLDALLQEENRAALVSVLGLHVAPVRIYANDLLATGRVESFFGESLRFGVEGGRLTVNGASLIGTDIQASNGVIHLIDSVLLPEEGNASAEESKRRSSDELRRQAAALCQLAIERGVPLFNNGQPEACAAIYEVAIQAMLRLGGGAFERTILDRLEMALAQAEAEQRAAARAWTYRRALDDVYTELQHAGRESRDALRRARLAQ